ncbi:MAG: hypothetical protein LBL75_02120 [Rickettsiales bacterium]|jgi:hypothetical protein|nr:hypothetical protein [Rickettsiales bacterium]
METDKQKEIAQARKYNRNLAIGLTCVIAYLTAIGLIIFNYRIHKEKKQNKEFYNTFIKPYSNNNTMNLIPTKNRGGE